MVVLGLARVRKREHAAWLGIRQVIIEDNCSRHCALVDAMENQALKKW